jgi:hypothetical protein
MFVLLFVLQTNLILMDDLSLYHKDKPEIVYYTLWNDGVKFFSIKLEAEIVVADWFFIGGSVKSLTGFPVNDRCQIVGVDYIFTTGVRLGENFEIGFRHECDHPVNQYYWVDGLSDYFQSYEKTKEEIYIQFKGKVKF